MTAERAGTQVPPSIESDSVARWIRRRRDDGPISGDLAHAFQGFRGTLELVEDAKSALAATAPRRRTPGLPLAQALAEFEQGLARASASMGRWLLPAVDEQWAVCRSALAESAHRAEVLRLGDAPGGYEELYGTLVDLMEPLDRAFETALYRFRELGL